MWHETWHSEKIVLALYWSDIWKFTVLLDSKDAQRELLFPMSLVGQDLFNMHTSESSCLLFYTEEEITV